MQRNGAIEVIEKLILSYLLQNEADLDEFVDLYPNMSSPAAKIKTLVATYKEKYTLPNYQQIFKTMQRLRTFAVDHLIAIDTTQSNFLDSTFELLEITLKPFVVKRQMGLLIALLDKLRNPSSMPFIENTDLRKTVERGCEFIATVPANALFGPDNAKERFDNILIMFFQLKIHELLPKFIENQCCHVFGEREIEVIEEEKKLHGDTQNLLEKRSSLIEQTRNTNFKIELVSFFIFTISLLVPFVIPRNEDGSTRKDDATTKLVIAMFFTMVISGHVGGFFLSKNHDLKKKLTFFQEKINYLLPKLNDSPKNENSLTKLHIH